MRALRDKEHNSRKDFLEKRRFNQLSTDRRVIWMVYNDEETPCSKVARFFSRFIDGTLGEFK